MKSFLMFVGKTIFTGLISAILTIVVVFLLAQANLLPYQGLIPQSMQINPSQSQTTSNIPLAYNDALSTYEKVATMAIQSSERALNLMTALFTALIGLAAVASGVSAYLYKTAREASGKADTAERAAANAKESVDNVIQQLKTLSENYIQLNDRYTSTFQQYMEIRNKTLSVDTAIQESESGVGTLERYIEAQQLNSWRKWIVLKDETGGDELQAHAKYDTGLVPSVRIAIEMEKAKLLKLQNNLSAEEKELLKKLIILLDIKPKDIL